MSDPSDKECRRIYNALRLYGSGALLALLICLTLFDVVDDAWMGNHYAGPPDWLTTLIAGLFTALFGQAAINAWRKKD